MSYSAVRTVAVLAVLIGFGCSTGVSNQLPNSPTPTPPDGSGNLDADLPNGDAIDWPPIDTGNGQDGDLLVETTPTYVNDCFEVTSGSGTTLTFANAPALLPDRRLLVMQVQDEFATSGPTAPVASAAMAGAGEIATVAAVNGINVTVADSLKNSYAAGTTNTAIAQACTVPEYEDVLVDVGGSIDARPWDGATGGIIAFYARGTVDIRGALDADFMGFRGGQIFGNSGASNVTDEDTAANQGGGKGEGLDGRAWQISGRGAMGNSGGGGNAHNAGGGGGGNGGAGGFGGVQSESFGMNMDTRGRPGGAIDLGNTELLVFGGGGGAAQQDDGDSGPGGAGGGIIFLSVGRLIGSGTITANGERGFDGGQGGSGEGGGGGGAGGSIVSLAITNGFAGATTAIGGDGGDHASNSGLHGTGGGGGGGRVIMGGYDSTLDVSGGASGVNTQEGNDPWGATSGEPGMVVTP